ncbi:nucleotide disphospho-sugar-binding domain-containing protein [Amycolatopsis anabasis]|uniref:nucleotide disphospho-sugar-binding domain-containing protein n=1 Tax=Amycolatopsis anabasis TaxID=1840409 RepID=UPI00131B8ECA|nr:nucleotide disphospho-sugar-binding domain-containing protein [Amycolatopsis anabasis]
MRVLFISTPGAGFAFPMVPLAWAMRAAGHEVTFTTCGDGLAVERAGLEVLEVAPIEELIAHVRETQRRHPELVARLGGPIVNVHENTALSSRFGTPFLPRFLAVARSVRPDLVVYSPLQVEGLLVASILDVPAVVHGFGFLRTAGLPETMAEHYDAFAEFGVGLPRRIKHLDLAPASMLDEPEFGWPMRPVPYDGGAVLPDWLREIPDRPRVAVTLGTMVLKASGITPLKRLVAEASTVDADFVLALGGQDIGALGPLPANVHAGGCLPWRALLRTCSAAIHHGGAGTTLGSLDAGVPQLVLPEGADRGLNAEAVRARGCGLLCRDDEVDAATIRTVLEDPSLRVAAWSVQAELADMPAPAELVPLLAELTCR